MAKSTIEPIVKHGFNAVGKTPKRVFRIPQEDLDWAAKFASRMKVSVNEIVRQAVAKYRRERERAR